MKIVEVLFYLQSGGAERFVVDLSNEISKEHQVTLLALKDDSIDPDIRQFYKPELSSRVKYDNCGLGKGLTLSMFWKVYKCIKKEKPDVVHMNCLSVSIFCAFAMLLLSYKVKFVQTIHSDVKNGYNGSLFKLIVKIFGYSKCLKFVALTNKNYDDFKQLYPHAYVTVIENGRSPIVPTQKMPDVISELKSLKVAETSKIYLHIARCHKVKNQELLVQAFSNFISEGYDAILVIIGQDYQTDMGKHLQSIAPKDVHFLGTRKNVSDYMLASDCFCLSSIFEGLPITMIEASLAGKPIVSTPVMGAYEIIENGVNGIICNTNEVNDYKECLVTSYKNLSLLTDGADKKKKKSKYTIAVCARKYIDLFLK